MAEGLQGQAAERAQGTLSSIRQPDETPSSVVLLFSPTLFSPPAAVFWSEEGALRSHVAEDGPETRRAFFTLMSRDSNLAWEEVFLWLSDRTLQTHRWDAFHLRQDMTPVELLDRLRAKTRLDEIEHRVLERLQHVPGDQESRAALEQITKQRKALRLYEIEGCA